jgi:hypothetical protein
MQRIWGTFGIPSIQCPCALVSCTVTCCGNLLEQFVVNSEEAESNLCVQSFVDVILEAVGQGNAIVTDAGSSL